ncbi:EamA/RhaT family transporter [Halobacillus fulvus]|nr:EamA/RhaT family transporter [Halobacillus fulvus]
MKINGIVLVLLGAASFGFTPIFVKTGYAFGYSLGEINLVQMISAFIILWSLKVFKKERHPLSNQDRLKVMATGTTVGLTSIFYYAAMQYVTASLAIILLFQFVWIGMIYEWIFTKKAPERKNLLALVITLTGVLFASGIAGGSEMELPLVGLGLGLLSGASYAGFIFFSGQVVPDSDPLTRSSFMVAGSMILILFVFVQEIPRVFSADGRLWTLGMGVALVGAVLPPFLFAAGAPLISARLANVLSTVELPVAIVSAMIILSEPVTPWQWVGVGLIIGAVFINEWGRKRPAPL